MAHPQKTDNSFSGLLVETIIRGILTLEQGEAKKTFSVLQKGLENLVAQNKIYPEDARQFRQLRRKILEGKMEIEVVKKNKKDIPAHILSKDGVWEWKEGWHVWGNCDKPACQNRLHGGKLTEEEKAAAREFLVAVNKEISRGFALWGKRVEDEIKKYTEAVLQTSVRDPLTVVWADYGSYLTISVGENYTSSTDVIKNGVVYHAVIEDHTWYGEHRAGKSESSRKFVIRVCGIFAAYGPGVFQATMIDGLPVVIAQTESWK